MNKSLKEQLSFSERKKLLKIIEEQQCKFYDKLLLKRSYNKNDFFNERDKIATLIDDSMSKVIDYFINKKEE